MSFVKRLDTARDKERPLLAHDRLPLMLQNPNPTSKFLTGSGTNVEPYAPDNCRFDYSSRVFP
jgi:hypothetical protein